MTLAHFFAHQEAGSTLVCSVTYTQCWFNNHFYHTPSHKSMYIFFLLSYTHSQTAGRDFIGTSGTVELSSTNPESCIDIVLIPENAVNPHRTFQIALSSTDRVAVSPPISIVISGSKLTTASLCIHNTCALLKVLNLCVYSWSCFFFLSMFYSQDSCLFHVHNTANGLPLSNSTQSCV